MEQCNFCGGTKTNPRPLPCNVCNGIGRVLGMLRDDPWLNIMPATSFNKSVHSDYYEHVCLSVMDKERLCAMRGFTLNPKAG